MRSGRSVLGVLVLAVCGTSWAQGGEDEGKPHTHWWSAHWYAGASARQSSFEGAGLFLFNDGAYTSIESDDNDFGGRIFAGLTFLEVSRLQCALELGYFDAGEESLRAQSDGSGTFWSAGPTVLTYEAAGIDLSLLGTVRVGGRFMLQGRVGAVKNDIDGLLTGTTQGQGFVRLDLSERSTKGLLGAGLGYSWTNVRLMAEYTWFEFETLFADERVEGLAVSAAYQFGKP